MNITITLFAYIIDRLFGEFNFIKHPVIFMGDFIKYFEKNFYKDSIFRGFLLTISLLILIAIVVYPLTFLPWYIQAIIASMGIASNMLYNSVKDIISNPKNIKYLVSRDTKDLSSSDINKAAIETYGENFSDGVVAPLFYLLFFGILGLFIYKGVNTLDSMVGYRTKKYEKFGKFSARLDDVLNYIPSRITAFLIAILMFSKKAFFNIFKYASLHESINAGYPISAIAGICDVSLGGDTVYNGVLKPKPYFGDGIKKISSNHILKALSFQIRFDLFIVIFLTILLFIF
jgi:adenosylcobinamide-phosphate synthase